MGETESSLGVYGFLCFSWLGLGWDGMELNHCRLERVSLVWMGNWRHSFSHFETFFAFADGVDTGTSSLWLIP